MSLPKILAVVSIILFGVIGVASLFKGGKNKAPSTIEETQQVVQLEVELDDVINEDTTLNEPVQPEPQPEPVIAPQNPPVVAPPEAPVPAPTPPVVEKHSPTAVNLPDANRIQELFTKDSKLPIVQTITYKSRVSWQKGRPAWLSDYASHYNTSRHFIARSLNGKPDYFKMDVADGNKFNVFKQDKNFSFYLLVDATLLKMWFFYHDIDKKELVLLKTYKVGLGRVDTSKPSGLLTPHGKYLLGDKVAIYKPNVKGHFKGDKVEMIRIFGSRWIPFDRELEDATSPAKGFGIHGVPWVKKADGTVAEDTSSLGKYDSDGCIRLRTDDVEELFAIIITKPTTIEIVKHFNDAKLPASIN